MPLPTKDQHSIFGASAASRWRTCTASPYAIETAKALGEIPEDSSSEYADEGTLAHRLADSVAHGRQQLDQIGRPMRDHIAGYLAECQACIDLADKSLPGSFHKFEQQVPLYYREEDDGTMDFCAFRPHPENPNFGADFLDLKYGQGVKVDAFENDQLAIYAYSTIAQYEAAKGLLPGTMKVRLGIYQPRHHSFDGSVDWWVLSLHDLRVFAGAIKDDYRKAQNPDKGEFKGSPKACLFCPIKGICEHRVKGGFAGMPVDPSTDFDDEETAIALAQPTEAREGTTMAKFDGKDIFVTPEQVAWIVRHGKEVKKIIDDVTKKETERLEAGGEILGCKLVAGRQGNRTWADEEAAGKLLSNYLNAEERHQPRKLITAPQATAALKKHLDPKDPDIKAMSTQAKIAFGFQEQGKSKTVPLIHRPEGKASLVPIDDPRPALTFSQPVDDFDDEEGEENWA